MKKTDFNRLAKLFKECRTAEEKHDVTFNEECIFLQEKQFHQLSDLVGVEVKERLSVYHPVLIITYEGVEFVYVKRE